MHHVKVIMRSRPKINLISFKFSQIQFQCIALGNGEFYRKQYSKFISSKSYPIHPQRKGVNSSRSLTRYFSQSTLETWSIRNYRLRESTHPIQSASRRNWTSNSNSRRVLDVECRRPECCRPVLFCSGMKTTSHGEKCRHVATPNDARLRGDMRARRCMRRR